MQDRGRSAADCAFGEGKSIFKNREKSFTALKQKNPRHALAGHGLNF